MVGGRLDRHAWRRRRDPRPAEADQIGYGAGAHHSGIELAGNTTALDQHNAACDVEHEFEVLFHDQHREAVLVAQGRQQRADFLDDRGLDALGRLIEQKEPWQRHQGAREGEDLLLSARQRAAPAVHEPAEPRKNSHDPLNRPLLGLAGIRRPREAQVLLGAEPGKDAASLRHVGDAKPAAFVRRP